MKEDKCVYCESREGLEWHHIWPLSLGGPDEPYNMIRVCQEHHGILHEMKSRTNISNLTREGLEKTRAKGTVLGGLIKISPDTIRLMIADRVYHTLDWCSKKYGYDRSTINRSIKKYDEDTEEYIRRYNGQSVARQVAALTSAGLPSIGTPLDILPNPSPTVSDSDIPSLQVASG